MLEDTTLPEEPARRSGSGAPCSEYSMKPSASLVPSIGSSDPYLGQTFAALLEAEGTGTSPSASASPHWEHSGWMYTGEFNSDDEKPAAMFDALTGIIRKFVVRLAAQQGASPLLTFRAALQSLQQQVKEESQRALFQEHKEFWGPYFGFLRHWRRGGGSYVPSLSCTQCVSHRLDRGWVPPIAARTFISLSQRFSRRLAIYAHQYLERDANGNCIPARVYYIKFSSKGTCFLTAGDDGLIKLWDTATCRLCYTVKRHFADICYLDLCWNDRLAVSCCSTNRLKLWRLGATAWEPAGIRILPALPAVSRFLPRLTVTRDPCDLATPAEQEPLIFVLCEDGTIRIFRVPLGLTSQAGCDIGALARDFSVAEPVYTIPLESGAVVSFDIFGRAVTQTGQHGIPPVSTFMGGVAPGSATLEPWWDIYFALVLQKHEAVTTGTVELSTYSGGRRSNASPNGALSVQLDSSVSYGDVIRPEPEVASVSGPAVLPTTGTVPNSNSGSTGSGSQLYVCRLRVTATPGSTRLNCSHSWLKFPCKKELPPDVSFGALSPKHFVSAGALDQVYLWRRLAMDTMLTATGSSGAVFPLQLTPLIEEKLQAHQYRFCRAQTPTHLLASRTGGGSACITHVTALGWSDADSVVIVAASICRLAEKNKNLEKATTQETEISFFEFQTGRRLLSIALSSKIKSNVSFIRPHPMISSLLLIGTFQGQILLVNARLHDIYLFLAAFGVDVLQTAAAPAARLVPKAVENTSPLFSIMERKASDDAVPLQMDETFNNSRPGASISSPTVRTTTTTTTSTTTAVTGTTASIESISKGGLVFHQKFCVIENIDLPNGSHSWSPPEDTISLFSESSSVTPNTNVAPPIILRFIDYPEAVFLNAQWSPQGDCFVVSQKDGSFSIFTANGCDRFCEAAGLWDSFCMTPVEQFHDNDFRVFYSEEETDRVMCPFTGMEPHRMHPGRSVDRERTPLYFVNPVYRARLPLNLIVNGHNVLHPGTSETLSSPHAHHNALLPRQLYYTAETVRQYNMAHVDVYGNILPVRRPRRSIGSEDQERFRERLGADMVSTSVAIPERAAPVAGGLDGEGIVLNANNTSTQDLGSEGREGNISQVPIGGFASLQSENLRVSSQGDSRINIVQPDRPSLTLASSQLSRLCTHFTEMETSSAASLTLSSSEEENEYGEGRLLANGLVSSSDSSGVPSRSGSSRRRHARPKIRQCRQLFVNQRRLASSGGRLRSQRQQVPRRNAGTFVITPSCSASDEVVENGRENHIPSAGKSGMLQETEEYRDSMDPEAFWRRHKNATSDLRALIRVSNRFNIRSQAFIPRSLPRFLHLMDSIFNNPSLLENYLPHQRGVLLDRLTSAGRTYRHERRNWALSCSSNISEEPLTLLHQSTSQTSHPQRSTVHPQNAVDHSAPYDPYAEETARSSPPRKRRRTTGTHNLPNGSASLDAHHASDRCTPHDHRTTFYATRTQRRTLRSSFHNQKPERRHKESLSPSPSGLASQITDAISEYKNSPIRDGSAQHVARNPHFGRSGLRSSRSVLKSRLAYPLEFRRRRRRLSSDTASSSEGHSEAENASSLSSYESYSTRQPSTRQYRNRRLVALRQTPRSVYGNTVSWSVFTHLVLEALQNTFQKHQSKLRARAGSPDLEASLPPAFLQVGLKLPSAESWTPRTWITHRILLRQALGYRIFRSSVGHADSTRLQNLQKFFSNFPLSALQNIFESLTGLSSDPSSLVRNCTASLTCAVCDASGEPFLDAPVSPLLLFSIMEWSGKPKDFTTTKSSSPSPVLDCFLQHILQQIQGETEKPIVLPVAALETLLLAPPFPGLVPEAPPSTLQRLVLGSPTSELLCQNRLVGPFLYGEHGTSEFWVHPNCFHARLAKSFHRQRSLFITRDALQFTAPMKTITELLLSPPARERWHTDGYPCSRPLSTYSHSDDNRPGEEGPPRTFEAARLNDTTSQNLFASELGVRSRDWLLCDTRLPGDYVPQLGDIIRFFPTELLKSEAAAFSHLPLLESPLLAALPCDALVADIQFEFPKLKASYERGRHRSIPAPLHIIARLSLLLLVPHPLAGRVVQFPCLPTDPQPFVLLSEVRRGLQRFRSGLLREGTQGYLFIDGKFEKGLIVPRPASSGCINNSVVFKESHVDDMHLPPPEAYAGIAFENVSRICQPSTRRTTRRTPHCFYGSASFQQLWNPPDNSRLHNGWLQAVKACEFTAGWSCINLAWPPDTDTKTEDASLIKTDCLSSPHHMSSLLFTQNHINDTGKCPSSAQPSSSSSCSTNRTPIAVLPSQPYHCWEVFDDPPSPGDGGAGGTEGIFSQRVEWLLRAVLAVVRTPEPPKRGVSLGRSCIALRNRVVEQSVDISKYTSGFELFMEPVHLPFPTQKSQKSMSLRTPIRTQNGSNRTGKKAPTQNPPPSWAHAYWTTVPLPIHLNLILRRLRQGYYRSETSFFFDLRLLYTNTILFNGPLDTTTRRAKTLLRRILHYAVYGVPEDFVGQADFEFLNKGS